VFIFKDSCGRAIVPRTTSEWLISEEKAVQRSRTPIDVDGIDGMDEFDFYQELSNHHYVLASEEIEETYLSEVA